MVDRELFQHSALKEFLLLTFEDWGSTQKFTKNEEHDALNELSDTATHDPICIHKPMA